MSDTKQRAGRGGSRPGNPNGTRGGSRPTQRQDAKARGPKPDLVAHIRELQQLLISHSSKFDQAELGDAAEAATLLLKELQALRTPAMDWEDEIL